MPEIGPLRSGRAGFTVASFVDLLKEWYETRSGRTLSAEEAEEAARNLTSFALLLESWLSVEDEDETSRTVREG